MDALLIMIVTFAGFLGAYQLYGKYVGRRIFMLSRTAPVPAVELEDGIDYVPTPKEVIFGHHYASIAGTGPIVGPAIAVIALALLVLGVVASAFGGELHVVAPAFNATPEQAPPLWPFLFITIACGAISGFHSLVSSGTTSKQVRNEEDALFVGYGSMLMEGVLSTLVVIATCAGIGMGYATKGGELLTGLPAWTAHYASWASAAGLASKVGAFVTGSANMIQSLGIPHGIALVIMGVFVASFAGTTMDTATRIQRYVIAELFGDLKMDFLTGRFTATFIAVGTAAVLAFMSGASGRGALKLWPLFGATNQTLAALALIVGSVYLRSRGGLKWLVTGIPAVFMIVMTVWALVLNQFKFVSQENLILEVLNFVILVVALWIAVEGLIRFLRITPTGTDTPETVAT